MLVKMQQLLCSPSGSGKRTSIHKKNVWTVLSWEREREWNFQLANLWCYFVEIVPKELKHDWMQRWWNYPTTTWSEGLIHQRCTQWYFSNLGINLKLLCFTCIRSRNLGASAEYILNLVMKCSTEFSVLIVLPHLFTSSKTCLKNFPQLDCWLFIN